MVDDLKEHIRDHGKSKKAKVNVEDEKPEHHDETKTKEINQGNVGEIDPVLAVTDVESVIASSVSRKKSSVMTGEPFEESRGNVDLQSIGENRTFLATVSSKGISLEASAFLLFSVLV